MLRERSADIAGGTSGRSDVENQDVGADFLGINGYAGNSGKAFGQVARVLVVAMKDFRRLFERDQTGRREYAGLAHAAAEEFACDPRPIDEITGADQHRADRSAEPLRKAK